MVVTRMGSVRNPRNASAVSTNSARRQSTPVRGLAAMDSVLTAETLRRQISIL
jgi:hypothetical protein